MIETFQCLFGMCHVQICANSFYASLITQSDTAIDANDTQLWFLLESMHERMYNALDCTHIFNIMMTYFYYMILSFTHIHRNNLSYYIWAIYSIIISRDWWIAAIQWEYTVCESLCVCVCIVFFNSKYISETNWVNDDIPLYLWSQ